MLTNKILAHKGNFAEQLVFGYRGFVLLLFALLTIYFAYSANKTEIKASFLKTIPNNHSFVEVFLKNKDEVKGLGNTLRIAVQAPKNEDIFTDKYVGLLEKINNEIYLMKGVDKSYMKSIWMPAVRWIGVTEDGYEGGPLIPENYNGSDENLAQLRNNILRSGEIGRIIASDFRSTVIYVPLVERPGEPLNYSQISEKLEDIRARYEAQGLVININGFAKIMGDMIEGIYSVIMFFAVAVLITLAILIYFTRCIKSSLVVIATTLIAVVWLVGFLPLLEIEINPYSILIPFLIFAMGVSHGTQMMNGVIKEMGRGYDSLMASRLAVRGLFVAGSTALATDMFGFGVIAFIDIPVIKQVSIIAVIGVVILTITNLIMIPLILSYTGVSIKAAERAIALEYTDDHNNRKNMWSFFRVFTKPHVAKWVVICAGIVGVASYTVGLDSKVGDLGVGAPELRPDSRYNKDAGFFRNHFQAGSDTYVIFIKTPPGECANYKNLIIVDKLESTIKKLSPVIGTNSFSALVKQSAVGLNEGSFKWYGLPSNQGLINATAARAPRELFNATCDLLSVYAYLSDHKAETLELISETVRAFAINNNRPGFTIELAAGSSGIEAATNEVVKDANLKMLLGVYASVILFCLIAFRSWRATVCAVLPLILTSMIIQALMVLLDIGLKVSTLPVITLGVGIGVDYALYVTTVMLAWLRAGDTLDLAYYKSLLFTGRVVVFTGCTLSIAVAIWIFSPIKFQGDMGILLSSMFLLNMMGALVLVPALAHFLLKPIKAN